jgi:hypothetical protein
MEGTTLDFQESAFEAVAEKALAKGTGARGLRSIMEAILLEAMFEIPGSNVSSVVIDRAVVEGSKAAALVTSRCACITAGRVSRWSRCPAHPRMCWAFSSEPESDEEAQAAQA